VENGGISKVVVECRPTFAIVGLEGSEEQFPIAWEAIYQIAKQSNTEGLRLESRADRSRKRSKGKIVK
jgi:hypothetical protein